MARKSTRDEHGRAGRAPCAFVLPCRSRLLWPRGGFRHHPLLTRLFWQKVAAPDSSLTASQRQPPGALRCALLLVAVRGGGLRANEGCSPHVLQRVTLLAYGGDLVAGAVRGPWVRHGVAVVAVRVHLQNQGACTVIMMPEYGVGGAVPHWLDSPRPQGAWLR